MKTISPCRQPPHTYRAIVTTADSSTTVVGERDAGDRVVVAREGVQQLAGRDFPVLQRAVVAAGEQALAVRRDRHSGDTAVLLLEAARGFFAGRQVPDMDDRVAGGEDVFA